jgi:hypothetical protein
MKMQTTIERRLQKARTTLLLDHPFFGSLLFRLKGRESRSIKTMATQAKRGFVLLPRRWVVERSFAWAARFRRLARDYERLSQTLAAFHYFAFACLMLANLFKLINQSC